MKYLLIDSCIYKAEAFQFNKGLLNYINKLCQQDKVKLLYCEIIYKEVLSLMNEKCLEFNRNISSALKAISFLRDENKVKCLTDFKKDDLSSASRMLLDKYLKHPRLY